MIEERFELAIERVAEIITEEEAAEKLRDYFQKCAQFILMIKDTYEWIGPDAYKEADIETLAKKNKELYEDILPENYGKSYGNPDCAVEKTGEYGQLLSYLYTKLREMIPYAFEQKKEQMLIRIELFLEIYNTCVYAKLYAFGG